MAEVLTHDVVILGSGLAGLRAALELARQGQGRLRIALVSKLQVMRSHSVCAEGGTAAVLRPEEGDSLDLHAWDTVKGSDFLADQDVVEHFVACCPGEIYQLDHWGLPWSRREDGRILQRPFGGHSFPRATMAADKTGFFEMQTLYDTLQGYPQVSVYAELFVTTLLVEHSRFAGIVGLDLLTGRFLVLRGRALLIASGGLGVLYGFTTYSQTVTGDGQALAYRAGLALEDMEFVQFHPTGLVPSGILITEGARGEGGHLRNRDGERFMQKHAPEKMELAPRDLVARCMISEIAAGRGFPGEGGLDYLQLDLRHLGAERINHRLPLIRELCIRFVGLDPIRDPIPVRPVAHYTMGGIAADINGAAAAPGIWTAGEAACTSLHGANRLGTNSTAECLVWGRICGQQIAAFLAEGAPAAALSETQADAAERRVLRWLNGPPAGENPYRLKAELRAVMDRHVGVYRAAAGLRQAQDEIFVLRQRFQRVAVSDRSLIYNTNLVHVMELENLLELAEVVVASALAREESRGAHARTDFPARDDAHWLKHSLAIRSDEGPRLSYKPVTITRWQPAERRY